MTDPYYQDDYATIYHGDCLEILPTLADQSIDLVLTDPPYGIEKSSTKGDYESDFVDNEDYIVSFVVAQILPQLRRLARVVLTPGIKHLFHYPKPDSFGVFFYPSATSWQKWGTLDTNPILYYGDRPEKMGPLSWSETSTAPKAIKHPCAKPLVQWRKLVDRCSSEGGTILDPFMGSGTTLEAAKQLGRKAIGIELEEKYCEIAAERLQQEYMQF